MKKITETVACLIDAGDAFRPGGAPPVKEDSA